MQVNEPMRWGMRDLYIDGSGYFQREKADLRERIAIDYSTEAQADSPMKPQATGNSVETSDWNNN